MQARNIERARTELTQVCRLAYERGYICGTEGNFSLRLDEQTLLTTPAGTCKGLLSPSELVLTNLDGLALDLPDNRGKKPSSELKMHLIAYRLRPDIMAVAHAHPTTAVAFSVADKTLNRCVLPEAILTLGYIALAPYATPSTDEVPDSIAEHLLNTDTILLSHHGALTLGTDIFQAFYRLETLEHQAKTLLVAHTLGGEKTLTSEQVQNLFAICNIYGMTPPKNSDKLIEAGTK
ncbi:class II aldolase/adducin family protein [soil metagenome]